MTLRDGWNPNEYAHFRDARRAPFFDLLALVRRGKVETVLDAGCGTGELTHEAHRLLRASSTLGIDASPAMLARSLPAAGVEFRPARLPDELPDTTFDVVLSNSVLNWVPDHALVFKQLAARVRPGGQLAVQMPSNPRTAFSRCAEVVARRFSDDLESWVYESPVEEPSFYSSLLDTLGFIEQRVGTWHYPQVHGSPQGIADFARGGLLSVYRERLTTAAFDEFAAAYEAELHRELGAGRVFFAFRRVFVWGLRAGG